MLLEKLKDEILGYKSIWYLSFDTDELNKYNIDKCNNNINKTTFKYQRS